MPLTYRTSNNQTIAVEDSPFSAGGEGQVHKIISPANYQQHCAKIFFQSQRNLQKEQKIKFMISNVPPNLITNMYLVCWPVEVLYQGNQFVGFIMPLAFSNSILLYELATPKLKKSLPAIWQKFDRNTSNGILTRLKICVNIASSVHQIHSLNKYVLVDMKPQNILVTQDGKISIIDLDSIQISYNNKVAFPAKVATPEYVPPEGVKLDPSKDVIPVTWDRFSLSVMFYEILMGLHPYAASSIGQYNALNTISEKIQSGLFPFGSKAKYISTLPPLHNNFKVIPVSIQNMFLKAFEDGNSNPYARPSAENWGQLIYQEITHPTAQVQAHIPIQTQKIQTVQTPVIQTQTPTPTQKLYQPSNYFDYANFGIRFGAYLIDIVIFTIIQYALSFGFVYILSEFFHVRKEETAIFWLVILNIILVYRYFIKPEASSWQGTIGKKMVGIKVTDLNGYRISEANAVGRYFGKLLSTLLIFIGWLMPLWTDKKQALHDMVASTLVIKK